MKRPGKVESYKTYTDLTKKYELLFSYDFFLSFQIFLSFVSLSVAVRQTKVSF